MKTKWLGWFTAVICHSIKTISTGTPEQELEHDPYYYREQLSPYLEGTDYQIPGRTLTPDFREPEAPFYAYSYSFFKEENRPYRMSPHYHQYDRWSKFSEKDNPHLMGCYCCTVYKRFTPLAGCAVITTRHILTTASSTELVLKNHKLPNKNLENILGAWYDHNGETFNSSMYMTPARIHYHPKYLRPENVNISHPIVGYFDLAVWAATYPFYGTYASSSKACVCNRGGSHEYSAASSTPRGELLFIVGFQFIMAWRKKPMPWYKYAVRTRFSIEPCPKTEWGWFHCIPANWARYGIEPGAALHRCFEGYSWRYDGLIAINMFSMRLRSTYLTHYFHPIDTHPVLDFLYSSYMGRLPYEYLDYRFSDTPWKAPLPKPGYRIPWVYNWGEQASYNHIPFNY